MKKWNSLPLRWKLTLWSSLLIFILFASYNVLQYFVINSWTFSYEKQSLTHQLNEIEQVLSSDSEKVNVEQIKEESSIIKGINDKHQAIRILNKKGIPILSVTDGVNLSYIMPIHTDHRSFKVIQHWDNRILVLRAPIHSKQFSGTVEVSSNLETFDDFTDTIHLLMIAASIGALLLSFMGGSIISRKLLSNVQAVTDTMKKITVNGMQERVPVNDTNDELAQLGKLFNQLMDELEESFLQQKQFVEDASHELRTPLAIIHGHLTMLNRWGKDDPAVLDKSLQSSLKETERLNALVQELLELTRADSSEAKQLKSKPIQLSTTISHVIRNFEMLHPDFIFRYERSSDLYAGVNPRHLEQVLIIVLDNALKYSQEDKKEITVRSYQDGDTAAIEVMDYGIGIPEEDLPYILNRFYRVDKARSRKMGGHGLGLAIAKRLVEKYAGALKITSIEGEGTTVKMIFPKSEEV
ncbi:HAMP domain-containing sensor histidine kinase [Metabacillus sp. RGM 3146]|uniref:HAMP domain-containing sensor histidine kinase n=1 Tax=Metabacillus sp. RGM 3146 TaxID=3401092 RepID=UPI003B9C0C14